MNRTTSIVVLAAAAALEAGGDALIRAGLHPETVWQRMVFVSLGALILFAYGWSVNSPPWDFGKLLGIYVVFFFIFAQAISCIFFKQGPTISVLIGGALIVAGGIVIAAHC